MDLGAVHVLAAGAALVLGAAVLARPKGTAWHRRAGRLYALTMLAVTLPALLLYEATGRPGPFHLLAVVSLLTLGLGWRYAPGRVRRRGDGHRLVPHAVLMWWSWIGVLTAGLAQLAAHTWPDRSPWPVLLTISVLTALGLLVVPRSVSRAVHRPRQEVRAAP